MRIAVIGASKGTGLLTARQAIARGHSVVGVARTPPGPPKDGIEWIVGDARDAGLLARALEGADASIVTLGTPDPWRPTTLFSDVERLLIEARGPKRTILMTGLGAGDSRGHCGLLFNRVIFPLLLAKSYVDKDLAESLLMASGLDWTIVRPGRLSNGPPRNRACALVGRANYRHGVIRRADVASFLVSCVEQRSFLHQTPGLIDADY